MFNLETWSHIAGVCGLIAIIFTGFLSYRKKLLNTGFETFRNLYRVEMDDFKSTVLSNVNMFREMMNENDKRHTKTLVRIVELYENTNSAVNDQTNICKLFQVEKAGIDKLETSWKKKIETELSQARKDVANLKKGMNK